ncbi:hypothetical protein EVAR_35792_1 [Eumeta japonica]|uniref:Uncharacterized protein n=1 Tax=Eumeta variegata TaxID=151549 RepID=A0A4C1WQ04_EUMVA|nr:hypothetical protein EVAR_35792_1 [Eumeta japonica]
MGGTAPAANLIYATATRALLSLPLSSPVLPHVTFGNHLDASGKTTNSDLELKNFAQADNEDVGKKTDVLDDQRWYTRHVQESQYFTSCKMH